MKNKKLKLIVILAFVLPLHFALAQLQMPKLDPKDVETTVRSYFTDIPIMIDIAKCESSFRQYTNAGLPYLGGGGLYIGVFQISEPVHKQKALALGMDIYTLEGNLAYAKLLYNQQGTGPWKGCVPVSPSPASFPATAPAPSVSNLINNNLIPITKILKIGAVSEQVFTLQKILNEAGFVIADSGPGSPGQETARFGPLTKAAVQKFQCAKQIACDGDETTTGFGLVGPRTRAALLSK